MIPDGEPGKRRYGCWSGQPKGNAENVYKCVETVHSRGAFVSRQCSRLRGHGKDSEFCKQHASTNNENT